MSPWLKFKVQVVIKAGYNIYKQDIKTNRAYLVDQQGFAMMSYDLSHKGTEIIEDIEHLMKYSSQ